MSLNKLSKADLHLLEVFVSVVEAGGFSAAQVRLNVSTSTISRQISQLEIRLGLRLCSRGRGGFQLTNRGQAVFRAANSLFSAVDEFQDSVAATKDQLTGQLSLAVIDNWIADQPGPLDRALALFKEDAPEVTIDIHSLAPDDIEHAVLDGRIALGVGVFHRHKPGLFYEPIQEDPLELFCGKGHPLFGASNIQPEDLRNTDLVRRAYLDEQQVAPLTANLPSTAQAHQIEGIAFLILSGRYVGYLPVHYASRWTKLGLMQSLLPQSHSMSTNIEIVTKRGLRRSSITEVFIQLLQEEING
jgi:DNA-binding transcriptional LysR family regulator